MRVLGTITGYVLAIIIVFVQAAILVDFWQLFEIWQIAPGVLPETLNIVTAVGLSFIGVILFKRSTSIDEVENAIKRS